MWLRKPVSFVQSQLKYWQLYLIVLLPVIHIIIFSYIPMYGVQIAFKDFMINKGIIGSPWVGFKHFEQFFTSFRFWRLLKNTLLISVSDIIFSLPVAVAFAVILNEIRSTRFKKIVQTVTYAPYFISTVVLVGMLLQFTDMQNGILNRLIGIFGGTSVSFMSEPSLFVPIYVLSGLWQKTGYNAIVYLAALSGVDPQLYDAVRIDGANKVQKIIYVDIPAILPTIVIMLILSVGSVMNIGFEKIYLMQNPLNLEASQVISTYVYELGLTKAKYSAASAISFFNSGINCILLVIVNRIARKLNETSLW